MERTSKLTTVPKPRPTGSSPGVGQSRGGDNNVYIWRVNMIYGMTSDRSMISSHHKNAGIEIIIKRENDPLEDKYMLAPREAIDFYNGLIVSLKEAGIQ